MSLDAVDYSNTLTQNLHNEIRKSIYDFLAHHSNDKFETWTVKEIRNLTDYVTQSVVYHNQSKLKEFEKSVK